MGNRAATVFVDYQQRASEFSVGDLAFPLHAGVDESQAGTVTAVFPAIGQVDIEFAHGSGRFPVEDVQRVTDIAAKPPLPSHTTTPGGPQRTASQVADRVAHAFVKRALYWARKDRHYRGSKAECTSGKYICPRCKVDEDGNPVYLRPTNYKRSGGKSHRLLGCPRCLFLIKRQDIIGDPSYEPDEPEQAGWGGTMDQGFALVQGTKTAADHYEMVVKFSGLDGAKSMADMLAYIGKIGGFGHSFSIEVDPEDSELHKMFGFDGDGSDRILSVELDGKKVEAP